jgi:hypothetical protein
LGSRYNNEGNDIFESDYNKFIPIVKTFLETEFSYLIKHNNRLRKI